MMKASHLNLGSHTSTAGGLENALLIARKVGCTCVQLFSANQRQWNARPISDEQVDLFHQTWQQTGLREKVVHASYLINLAAINSETHKKSVKALGEELARCEKLQIDYLVMHPGAHMGRGESAAIKKIVTALNKVLQTDWQGQLLLETTAGQGSSVGCRFEHLAEIRAGLDDPTRVGICLDSCHVFAAGYDIKSADGYQQTIGEFDSIIGLEHLKVLHVNDSKTPLGSRVDRHEHLGKGKIGREGFKNLVSDNRINRLPWILETPKGVSPGGRDYDKINLGCLRRLADRS